MLGRQQVGVEHASIFFVLKAIMVEFTVFKPRFCVIGNTEDTVFSELPLDFVHALAVFQPEGLIHAVFQNECEVLYHRTLFGSLPVLSALPSEEEDLRGLDRSGNVALVVKVRFAGDASE